MRQLKFRAWDKKEKKMVSHDRLFRIDCSNEYPFLPLLENRYRDSIHPFDVEIMQCIGLKDKNGTEIYEDDIIRFPDAYTSCGEDGDWDETVSVGVIKWDNEQAMFYVTNRNSIDMESLWEAIDEVEVVGNIYENPELLEV